MSEMAIFEQLGDHGAVNTGHFFPVAINLLKKMEAPTSAQSTAGTTGIDDGPSLFPVEAYGGHDDVAARLWITLIETFPPIIFEEILDGVGTHNFVRLLNLELPFQEPRLFVGTVVLGDGIFEAPSCIGTHTWLRRTSLRHGLLLDNQSAFCEAIGFLVWKKEAVDLVRILNVVRFRRHGSLSYRDYRPAQRSRDY